MFMDIVVCVSLQEYLPQIDHPLTCWFAERN